ncbi:hypothetical protein D9M71_639220 [compost metagenome]
MKLFQFLLDAVAFERGQVIDEQFAIEVVAFVLDAHREQIFGDQFVGLAVAVQRLDLDPLRAIDVFVEARHRQTAFLVLAHVVGQRFELGVDEHSRLGAVFGEVHHDDTFVHVDLGSGEADARRFIHCFKHVVDQLTHFVVHYGHWLGDSAQTRIREFEDV